MNTYRIRTTTDGKPSYHRVLAPTKELARSIFLQESRLSKRSIDYIKLLGDLKAGVYPIIEE